MEWYLAALAAIVVATWNGVAGSLAGPGTRRDVVPVPGSTSPIQPGPVRRLRARDGVDPAQIFLLRK